MFVLGLWTAALFPMSEILWWPTVGSKPDGTFSIKKKVLISPKENSSATINWEMVFSSRTKVSSFAGHVRNAVLQICGLKGLFGLINKEF